MILHARDLPDSFHIEEITDEETITRYIVFTDVGEYTKHDSLFDKYGVEPSGYDWEEIVSNYLKQVAPDLLERIKFDCNGDEFLVFTEDEAAQLEVTKYFLSVCNDVDLLETLLSQVSRKE